ncbi:methylosome protein 50-like, partial [Limulus polyphemus]|uniref:Methylosome protein 50-like n=1 Tax=Limulus polyphemus TaxID=6850 RepID=A0ABM1BP93_LIMPO
MSSLVPAVVEKHLDSIFHWNDGTFVLASSNLTGRYWSGSVWCFKCADDAPNVEKCLTGVETDSGVCDAVSVEQNKVIIGTDSGSVELLEFQTNGEAPLLNSIFYGLEHDDLVSCVDVNSSGDKAVSCSYDKSIKIWDLVSMASVGTYRPAHTDLVWRISCCPVEPEVFLSCGQ